MSTLSLPWGDLHYAQSGDDRAPPLLLISGLNGLARPWQAVVPTLAAHYRVITHDHRGLGNSARWQGAYSVEQIASDVIALMDGLGIARAHIVGHSLGGAVAQTLAIDHPQRVDHLLIYASWAGPEPYFTRVMQMRREMLLGLGVEAFLRTGVIGIYPPDWIAAHHRELDANLPAMVQAFVGVPTMLSRMDACLAHDRRSHLTQIKAPTLVLGLEDDMSTPAYCSAALANDIPGAQLRLLPYGGHNAHLVVPDQVCAVILGFLPQKTTTSL